VELVSSFERRDALEDEAVEGCVVPSEDVENPAEDELERYNLLGTWLYLEDEGIRFRTALSKSF
jgi:hypothetical protein